MSSLANSLAGLSLLSGTSLGPIGPLMRVESRAVRAARAQFTLPPIAPIWREARPLPAAASLLRMPALIDPPQVGRWPADVATAFTAYKALERLRVLAEAGVSGGLDRGQLDARFAAGMGELERWLAEAPGDVLNLSFGRASRRAESIHLPAPAASETRGLAVVPARSDALPGLTGNERFTIHLSRPGASDAVEVDLTTQPQPPTLDRVAAALNGAISSLPLLNGAGQPIVDADGNPVPRYESRFAVVRSDKGWGLELRSGGIETVGLRESGRQPALLVTSGVTVPGGVGPVSLSRLTLPEGALERSTLSGLEAIDRAATAVQQPAKDGAAPPPVLAPVAIAASVSAADGFTYAVGTSRGSLGSQVGDGTEDLLLVKLDSLGRQVWQRSLGSAGQSQGLRVALDPRGGVVVGGTMAVDEESGRDLIVARFGEDGSERTLTRVRQIGDEGLVGMAVAGDGAILVAGRSDAGTTTLTRIESDGRVGARQPLAAEVGTIRDMTFAPDGDLLVLSQTGSDAALRRYDGGALANAAAVQPFAGSSASALAVSQDGLVAVGLYRGGNSSVALLRGGSVATVDIASGGDDRIDQMLFDGGDLFVGGRTTGDLGAPRSGLRDAFVARVDVASASLETVRQWGRAGTETSSVSMSLAPNGNGAVHRLGFADGTINPAETSALVDQTALRPGDHFTFRVDGGRKQKVTVLEGESAHDFAARITRLIDRGAGKVRVARADGGLQLRFEPAAGHRFDLLPGSAGEDALAKLGLSPGAIIVPPAFDPKAPRVRPGGAYGLDLATGLSLRDKGTSRQSLERVDSALATVRAAFRSLYWDETKQALAEGSTRQGAVSPYQAAQLARYRDALSRMGG